MKRVGISLLRVIFPCREILRRRIVYGTQAPDALLFYMINADFWYSLKKNTS